jgi:hypothetical protein
MQRRDFLKAFLGLGVVMTASTAAAPEAQASWVSDGVRSVGRGARRAGRAIGRGTRRAGRSINRGALRVRRQVFGRPRRRRN